MKNKKNKQAVSLIVLVITIIVMIILAGTIILSLDNSGIIDKAQTAVDKTNLAEIKNLAQMAWAEAYLNKAKTDEEFRTVVMDALNKQNITEEHYEGYTIEVTTSGVKFVEKAEVNAALNHSGIIPEGATYRTGTFFDAEYSFEWDTSNEVIYSAGEPFPEIPSTWDTYTYNGVTYYYNAVVDTYGGGWVDDTSLQGWMADTLQTEKLLLSINGKNVISLSGIAAWATISEIEECVIPEQITDIRYLFHGADVEEPITVIINSNPTQYKGCFADVDMSKITLAGKCSRELKQLIANTGENADKVTIID